MNMGSRFHRRSLWSAMVVSLFGLLVVLSTAAPAEAIPPPSSGPVLLVLDAQAGRLYTCLAFDNRILVIDTASGQLVQTIAGIGVLGDRDMNAGIGPLTLDPQLGRLFVVNTVGRTFGSGAPQWVLFAIDAAQGTIVQQLPLASLGQPSWMLADAIHGKLYAGYDQATTVYDAATLAVRATLPLGSYWALLDAQGSRLFLMDDANLTAISTVDETVLAKRPLPAGFTSPWAALDPSHHRLYGVAGGAIQVFDTANLEWLAPLTGAPAAIGLLAADPVDGELYSLVAGQVNDMTYHVSVLSPQTGEVKAAFSFQEPKLPEGYTCSGYAWINVSKLVPDPAGGRIYGTGNAMTQCQPPANLVFVLDTSAGALAGWLPHLAELPVTGGRPFPAAWLMAAGSVLLLAGLLLRKRQAKRGP